MINFEMPPEVEQRVLEFASQEKISASEALLRLVRGGLASASVAGTRIPGLTGVPMDDNEAHLMDDIVEQAMGARTERWANDRTA